MQQRGEDKRRAFEVYAEPIMQHLLVIHEDYVRAMADIHRMIQRNETKPQDLLDRIVEKRETYLHLRVLVRNLIREWWRCGEMPLPVPDTELTDSKFFPFHFAQAVTVYITYAAIPPDDAPDEAAFSVAMRDISNFSSLISTIDMMQRGLEPPYVLSIQVAKIREQLPVEWERICRCYARLKAACQ